MDSKEDRGRKKYYYAYNKKEGENHKRSTKTRNLSFYLYKDNDIEKRLAERNNLVLEGKREVKD